MSADLRVHVRRMGGYRSWGWKCPACESDGAWFSHNYAIRQAAKHARSCATLDRARLLAELEKLYRAGVDEISRSYSARSKTTDAETQNELLTRGYSLDWYGRQIRHLIDFGRLR